MGQANMTVILPFSGFLVLAGGCVQCIEVTGRQQERVYKPYTVELGTKPFVSSPIFHMSLAHYRKDRNTKHLNAKVICNIPYVSSLFHLNSMSVAQKLDWPKLNRKWHFQATKCNGIFTLKCPTSIQNSPRKKTER